MANEDSLRQRGNAMEDAFFLKKDAQLLEQLRQSNSADIDKSEIAKATGIQEQGLLDQLVAVDINLETLAALSVIPLVEVAWADGRIEKNERDAVLEAADKAGVAKDGPGYQLLHDWLEEKPDGKLFDCWKQYVAALAGSLDEQLYATVRDNLLDRARDVATAAGGILGLGSISAAEKAKLEELKAAFAS